MSFDISGNMAGSCVGPGKSIKTLFHCTITSLNVNNYLSFLFSLLLQIKFGNSAISEAGLLWCNYYISTWTVHRLSSLSTL